MDIAKIGQELYMDPINIPKSGYCTFKLEGVAEVKKWSTPMFLIFIFFI